MLNTCDNSKLLHNYSKLKYFVFYDMKLSNCYVQLW